MRATVVLPVPGGPEKTRCRDIGGMGSPACCRRCASRLRSTSEVSCRLTESRPISACSPRSGPCTGSSPAVPRQASCGRRSPPVWAASGALGPVVAADQVVRGDPRVGDALTQAGALVVDHLAVGQGDRFGAVHPQPVAAVCPTACTRSSWTVPCRPGARRAGGFLGRHRVAVRVPSSSTVKPSPPAEVTSLSRNVPCPRPPTDTPAFADPRTVTEEKRGWASSRMRMPVSPLPLISESSICPNPRPVDMMPCPLTSVTVTRRSTGSADPSILHSGAAALAHGQAVQFRSTAFGEDDRSRAAVADRQFGEDGTGRPGHHQPVEAGAGDVARGERAPGVSAARCRCQWSSPCGSW